MAKVVQTTLQISEANVEQYCTADGLSLNTGGYAIRLYLNGHTQGSAILNNAAKEVLYPSATAHPFKIDSFIRANKSGGRMTISLQFDGTSVQSETGDWGSELKNKIKEGISDPVVINSNRSAEIKWHIKGSSTVSRFSIASTRLTFYFNQYEMRPLVGNNANGIQKVTVSNASPCYGDTVVFTPKLVQGATWAGWYSDAACTQLVSADQNYSVSPSSDITLYAKATIDATLYNVNAVAGTEIASVSVSDSIVPEGSTTTFTAQVNTGCSFEAWYSDDTYTTVVSTENPYTTTITANTTLYAKAHKNSLNMSVGSAEHGTASVSATTVPYGSDVTFTFTPEDETWELYGWYSDSGLTQLVSEANPYTFTVTEDVTLYPKVGKKRYTITLQSPGAYILQSSTQLSMIAVKTELITVGDMRNLRAGNFAAINPEKIIAQQSKTGDEHSNFSISIVATIGSTVALHAEDNSYKDYNTTYFLKDNVQISNGPYYVYQVSDDATFNTVKANNTVKPLRCNCTAIALDGIEYAEVYPKEVAQGLATTYTADVNIGYTFAGWYSDEACTKFISSNNPYEAVAPEYTTEDRSATSLTLYAKATKVIYTIGVGTAEHGSATVSTTTAHYGDTVTFNCTVDEGYGFKGWYSDEGLTRLVSEANPYTFRVTKNITLYPKVEIGKDAYTITLTFKEFSSLGVGKMAIVDFDSLTEEEIGFLKSGNYDSIDANKVYDIKSVTPDNTVAYRTYTVSIRCPSGLYVAMYLQNYTNLGTKYYKYIDGYTWWPYYWYQPNQDASFNGLHYTNTDIGACNCTAIAKDNISSVDATTPVVATKKAIFTAKVNTGCSFVGWYSDEACTQLVSNSNPAYVVTPQGELSNGGQYRYESSLTLYAKATKAIYTIGVGTAEHGSASVSATTAHYGDTVTFNCTVDEGCEFKGWYSDEGLTQLVSESAEYVHSVTGDVTLWPKVEIKIYNLILHPTGYDAINFSSNTKIENVECLYENDSHSFNSYAEWYINGETGNTSTNPASLAFYIAGEKFINIPDNAQITDINILIRMGNDAVTQLPKRAQLHGIYTAQRNIENSEVSYNQVGIKKYSDTEFSDTEIIPYNLTNAEVGNWTLAALKTGKFGIVLTASFDPTSIWVQAAPHIYNIDISISYNLLPNASATGISLKLNGTWKNALAVFKKTNGAWVQQSNPKTLFSGSSTGSESNYIYCGDVSS